AACIGGYVLAAWNPGAPAGYFAGLSFAGCLLGLALRWPLAQRGQEVAAKQHALQRHDLAVRAMRGVVWQYDAATDRLSRDPHAPSLLGFGPGQRVQRLDEMLELVDPPARDECRRFIERIRSGPQTLIEQMLPFRHRDGSLRHLRL